MRDNTPGRSATPYRYCAGCGHRVMHNLIARTVDELGIRHRVIGIAPVGCAVFAYEYFNFDMLEAPHGRPPAAATGLKRARPGNIVFSYQGDGDLAAIGLSEIVHTASRGENISVFFINNATYGMTGGQMAPTTLIGQKTSTTRHGRSEGSPMKMAELLASLGTASFIARGSLDTAEAIGLTSQYVRRAFEVQMASGGFSFVEALSACPTDWHMSPSESAKWISSAMRVVYPTGVLQDSAPGGGA